jgi:hypothetical protein
MRKTWFNAPVVGTKTCTRIILIDLLCLQGISLGSDDVVRNACAACKPGHLEPSSGRRLRRAPHPIPDLPGTRCAAAMAMFRGGLQ